MMDHLFIRIDIFQNKLKDVFTNTFKNLIISGKIISSKLNPHKYYLPRSAECNMEKTF